MHVRRPQGRRMCLAATVWRGIPDAMQAVLARFPAGSAHRTRQASSRQAALRIRWHREARPQGAAPGRSEVRSHRPAARRSREPRGPHVSCPAARLPPETGRLALPRLRLADDRRAFRAEACGKAWVSRRRRSARRQRGGSSRPASLRGGFRRGSRRDPSRGCAVRRGRHSRPGRARRV